MGYNYLEAIRDSDSKKPKNPGCKFCRHYEPPTYFLAGDKLWSGLKCHADWGKETIRGWEGDCELTRSVHPATANANRNCEKWEAK